MRPELSGPRGSAAFAICGLLVLALTVPRSLAAQTDAKALYGSRCAMCHGVGGAGDGAAAKAIKTPMPDFTDSALGAARTDDQLNASITNGKTPGMPAFGKQFKTEQIKGLVAYIRQFQKPSAK